MAQIGVITEQGDLGLGFDPLSKKDSQTIKEHRDHDDGCNKCRNCNCDKNKETRR